MIKTKPKLFKHALGMSVLTAMVVLVQSTQAATPQNLSANIDGKKFESDDDGILYLMPTKSVLNLIAKTKGASAYPPPKTLPDKLSINCKNFEAKPRKYSSKEFGSSGCEVSFIKGESNKPFGEPVAAYKIVDGNNSFEVTSVKGKVIEGKFSFEMIDVKTKAKIKITDGIFKAEDRQL